MMLATVFAFSSPAVAQTAHPFKLAGGDPAALTTPDVTTETSDGGVSKTRVMGTSKDGHFRSGISSYTGGQGSIDTYPVDEFMFFIKGGVTLTSTDGTALQVRTGESVYIPKGWKGTWESKKGYIKFYSIYDAVKAAE